MISSVLVHRIAWNGIELEISYRPDWMPHVSAHLGPVAHLQIRSVQPERAALPVTETGYISRFLEPAVIAAAGGAVAFVRSWLDDAGASRAWLDQQDAARQLTLF